MDMQLVKFVPILAKQVGTFVMRNSPSILTGLGAGGVVATVVSAVSATPKAMDIIMDERSQREADAMTTGMEIRPVTKIEIVKLTWKEFIPTAVLSVSTIFCIIGANSINLHRNAALAGLYGIADSTLKEYQQKVKDTYGEKKEAKLREEIAQDKVNRNPADEKQILFVGKGDTLCYDPLSARYFMGNIDKINRAINYFNSLLINEADMTLNEFYDEIGLPHCEIGDTLGWSVNNHLVDVTYTATIAKDNQPCIVLNFRYGPVKI
jgi:hypothetical protein